MPGLRNMAIHWYRKVFGAPAGSDIRDEGLSTVLDGDSAVFVTEAGIASHAVHDAEGPRGIVAAATGLALAGRRATAYLSGPDIAAAQDLLISAAGKHAPIVLHMSTRAIPAHGSSPGSSHDAVHLSVDSGCFMLFAANVQEAVDFTCIARRVAEESLVPGIVIMDGEQTALAAQDVRLLSPAQVDGFVGSPRDEIESPSAAQKLLFGETRRRLPAWHDLDEPVLTGALFETESFALGASARGPFFDAFVRTSLATAFEQFERKTGRHHEPVSHYRLDDAKTVLVAQGAAIETARVAADALRRQHKIKTGVLGVHSLRPFPAAGIRDALAGRDQVFVLERVDVPLSAEPPLTREVCACVERGVSGPHPSVSPVVYGIGGLPLRVADIIELCTGGGNAAPLFLGLQFDDMSGDQPKREVLLDALRRAYPDVAAHGVSAAQDQSPSQADQLTIAIRRAGDRGRNIVGSVGALLHALDGGRIRSRPAAAWDHWSDVRIDWITHGGDALQDPGDGLSADVTLDLTAGTIVLGDAANVYRAPQGAGDDSAGESMLGALFGVLKHSGKLDDKPRQIIAARRSMLGDIDERRRDELLTAFQSGFEQVAEADAVATVSEQFWDGEAPEAVRHLGRDDDHYASLPRFWDQTGVLYREGKKDHLTADPYLATGTMPPLSSTFIDASGTRQTLPVFDPTLCTGCGLCWTRCPDSAIGVVAMTPAALIEAGINRTGAEAVRQVASKLASRMIAANKKAESVAPTFGELLDESYAWLEEKLPLPDERKQAIQDGIKSIDEELGALPVAVTTPFFLDAEAQKKDSAELLSLAINPDACKACGLCIVSCEPNALAAAEQEEASLVRARNAWSIWAKTPDTAAETIERVAENPDIGSTAAILLSRYCQFALAGGDPAEAGSGEKMAVRLALAATEFYQQPIAQRFAKSLGEAGDEVVELIRQTLSGTLAIGDLDAVTEKLKNTTSPRVGLATLADTARETGADHSVDTAHLLRLIDLSNDIASTHHRLVQGEHGLGRARYGLAIAGGSAAAWAGAFPHNPFQAPVLIDMSGDAAQLAAGLIEGHLEETVELARLLRLARLEIDQPDGADWKREAIMDLRWRDLRDEEHALCPPLILAGSDEMLAGRGLSQLIWLLNSGLPVKVLVLSALAFGTQEAIGNDPRGNLGLLALAQRNAYVAQSSVADPAHLGESMLQALAFDGPALIQVYAPSPSRHGFASDRTVEQARLAVECRAMPLFRYDPTAEGVFGSRISLAGNPAYDAALVKDSDGDHLLTPADWAHGQERFAASFEPLAEDAPGPVALHEWLQLDAKGRSGKTPTISIDEQQYSVAPALANIADHCLQNWRTLQEVAGIVTPFTERLEQEIRAEVAAEHQAELDAQRKAAAADIAAMQEKTKGEIAGRIRSRLLELAKKKRG